LGINGGEIFPGVTAIASDQIAINSAVLFDATAIVGNSDVLVPDRSDVTSLQMETSPDSPPTAATTIISLWQSDEVAMKLERWWGFTIMRTSGVASLSGVNY
jgi:hypothetical protein